MRSPKARKQQPSKSGFDQRTGATLADVAAEVGVSINTVSRSFRAPHTVRPGLRQRIGKIAEELNYVPNNLAGGLAGARSSIVGVVVTSLSYSEFAAIIDTLQQELAAAGLQVLIGNSAYDPEEELRLVRAMLSWRPAAIALVGTDHHPKVTEILKGAGVPVIEFWDATDPPLDTVVGMDHRQIGRKQAQHLIDLGCKNIGFVGAVREHDHRALKRLKGAQEWIAKKLKLPMPATIHRGPGVSAVGDELAAALLAREPKVDGIICNSDIIAFGVLRALARLDMKVPDDVAVVGFGDNDAGTCITPALTTIRPPRVEIGRILGEVILARIAGRHVREPLPRR